MITGDTLMVKWNYTSPLTGTWMSYSSAVADVNGDGQMEIVISSDDCNAYCLSSSGQVKWVQEALEEVKSSPAIADVDGDGQILLFFQFIRTN